MKIKFEFFKDVRNKILSKFSFSMSFYIMYLIKNNILRIKLFIYIKNIFFIKKKVSIIIALNYNKHDIFNKKKKKILFYMKFFFNFYIFHI